MRNAKRGMRNRIIWRLNDTNGGGRNAKCKMENAGCGLSDMCVIGPKARGGEMQNVKCKMPGVGIGAHTRIGPYGCMCPHAPFSILHFTFYIPHSEFRIPHFSPYHLILSTSDCCTPQSSANFIMGLSSVESWVAMHW